MSSIDAALSTFLSSLLPSWNLTMVELDLSDQESQNKDVSKSFLTAKAKVKEDASRKSVMFSPNMVGRWNLIDDCTGPLGIFLDSRAVRV